MNKCLEKKKQGQNAQRPCWAMRASASASAPARFSQESIEHIHVGSFYEIDQSKLPPTTPEQLQSIRVVKVSEKTLFNVSVRFPSPHSLKTHLNEDSYENPDGGLRKQLPELDEVYSMSPAIASEVLCRRLPHQEIAEQSKTWSFWAVRRRSANPKSPSSPGFGGGVMSPSPCSGTDEEGKPEIEETEIDEEDDKAQEESPYELRKRKKPQKKPKTEKRPKQNTQNKQKLVEASTGRWPASRYKAAEENILKVMKAMKAKGVSAENPILREPLKSEARKFIGDTGLIDHLLKHMAEKVDPGGADRFQRRRNTDGAFEYWLESASIRKEAGVEDPCGTPPPGRKSGDDPTQHPTCARMSEAIAKWKREGGFKHQEDLVTTSNQGQANSSVIPEVNNERKFFDARRTNARRDLSRLNDKYTELAVEVSGIHTRLLQLSQDISAMGGLMKSLLPSVSMSPKGVVPQTDSFLVPTPPPVSFPNESATRLVLNTPNGLNPGSPVKPLPERHAVNISTLSNSVTPRSQIDSISVGKSRDINLNEFPNDIDSISVGKTRDINLNEFPNDIDSTAMME